MAVIITHTHTHTHTAPEHMRNNTTQHRTNTAMQHIMKSTPGITQQKTRETSNTTHHKTTGITLTTHEEQYNTASQQQQHSTTQHSTTLTTHEEKYNTASQQQQHSTTQHNTTLTQRSHFLKKKNMDSNFTEWQAISVHKIQVARYFGRTWAATIYFYRKTIKTVQWRVSVQNFLHFYKQMFFGQWEDLFFFILFQLISLTF